jgi:hypothetical protein
LELVISVALSCIIDLASGFGALWYVSGDPSTAVLEADLAAVRVGIARAEADAAQFGGALADTRYGQDGNPEGHGSYAAAKAVLNPSPS